MRVPSGVAYFVVILLVSVSLKDPSDLLVHNVVAVCESSTDVIMGNALFFQGANDCFLCGSCAWRHGKEYVEKLWFIWHGWVMLLNAYQLHAMCSTLKHVVKHTISAQATISPQNFQILPSFFQHTEDIWLVFCIYCRQLKLWRIA